MFIAFYLSLWICNFLTVSYVIAQGDSTKHAKWVFLSLLPGVLRQALIDTGAAKEAKLKLSDLKAAEAIFVGNSLRGLMPAKLIDFLPH